MTTPLKLKVKDWRRDQFGPENRRQNLIGGGILGTYLVGGGLLIAKGAIDMSHPGLSDQIWAQLELGAGNTVWGPLAILASYKHIKGKVAKGFHEQQVQSEAARDEQLQQLRETHAAERARHRQELEELKHSQAELGDLVKGIHRHLGVGSRSEDAVIDAAPTGKERGSP